MKTVKFTVITKKITQLLNLNPRWFHDDLILQLIQDEIDILKLGLSFTPTPKQNIAKLKNDIFQFTRKLWLNYHHQSNNIVDESIVKLESTNTLKPNENTDSENIFKELEHTKISLLQAKDNLYTLRKELDSRWRKIENKEIIVKPAEKGSFIIIMSPDYYWNICQAQVSDTLFYRILNDAGPLNIVQQRFTQFADKWKPMLTLKDYNYLTKTKHKISNLYMLPKLHKSKQINEIIQKQQCEYINIKENFIVEAFLIVDGSIYHISSISEILHIIMEPSLAIISHIAKDTFDVKNRLDK